MMGATEDPFGTQWDTYSVQAYIKRHVRDLESYVRTRYPRESYAQHLALLLERTHPNVTRCVIENYRLTNDERWKRVIQHYKFSQSSLTLIIGKKGGMKSTFGWDLARSIMEATGRPVAATGEPMGMPEWVRPIDDLNKAPTGSIVLTDELGVEANARNSNTKENKSIATQLPTMRHRRIILIGIVQNLSLADRNFIALADDLVIKPLGLMQMITERKGVGKIIKEWEELMPKDDSRDTFILSKETHAIRVRRERPVWLDEAQSETYAKIRTRSEAIERALAMAKRGVRLRVIQNRLTVRGWSWSDQNLSKLIKDANGGNDPWKELA